MRHVKADENFQTKKQLERQKLIDQRNRSLPIRWTDCTTIDPAIQQHLMKGTWQGMIPVNGTVVRMPEDLSGKV